MKLNPFIFCLLLVASLHAQPYRLAVSDTSLNAAATPSLVVNQIASIADVILVQRHWNPAPNPNGASFGDSAATSVSLARAKGLKVFLALDPLTTDRTAIDLPPGMLGDFSTQANRDSYEAEAVSAASRFRPDYFLLAVEINTYKSANPASYSAFRTLYEATRLQILSVSPNTKIAVSFHYNNSHSSCFAPADLTDMAVLDSDFTQNVFAVSVYPFCYILPSNIPTSFLYNLARVSRKPLFISETAWLSNAYGFTPQMQSDYVARLATLSNYAVNRGATMEALTYISLVDPDANVCSILTSMGLTWYCYLGLMDLNLAPKPAFSTFKYWHDSLAWRK